MIGRRRQAACFALLLSLLACRSPAAPADPIDAPARARAGAPATGRVVVESPSGRSVAVRVEVMRTESERERGLMFRQHLGADEGMLFVFPQNGDHAFWMKNTFIALDMIFIGETGTIVGIVPDVAPMSTNPRAVGTPSRYVLEVNGGWSATHGVARGDRVRFEGIPLP